MQLVAQVSKQFSNSIRQRGQSYFARRRVRIIGGNASDVRAIVSGTDDYEVHLKRNGAEIKASCTCPYFQNEFLLCKHIWAAILAVERTNYLNASAGEPVYVVEDDDALMDADQEDARQAWEEDDEGWDDDYDYDEDYAPRRAPISPRARKTQAPHWKTALAEVGGANHSTVPSYPSQNWPPGREILYIVDVPQSVSTGGLVLELAYRERKQNGDWSKPKVQSVPLAAVPAMTDANDQYILTTLAGARPSTGYADYYYYDTLQCRYKLSAPLQEMVLPAMCRTGRAWLRPPEVDAELRPLHWDDGLPWELCLAVAIDGKNYLLTGSLQRGDERMPVTSPVLVIRGGVVFWDDRAARLHDAGTFDWIRFLRRETAVKIPAKDADKFLAALLRQPHLPRLELPEELRFEEVNLTPKPRLIVKPKDPRRYSPRQQYLIGRLEFDYEGKIIPSEAPEAGVFDPERRRLLRRDQVAEEAANAKLLELGFRSQQFYGEKPYLELAPRQLPNVVRELTAANWHVEAEGKLFRQAGQFQMKVESGIDWFELHGSVEFGEETAQLPELLAALRKGETSVRLGDGTYGMLPEAWLKKYGLLANLGKTEGDHLRFGKAQVGLLDALLATQPEATFDAAFAQARDALRNFDGVKAVDPANGFVGQLRGYQREGLGWLQFLPTFGFGGCLADDMGLGKTVQVLALLEARREERAAGKSTKPSLAIVPRSLVFNWKQEATRFTPKLRVLDHSGGDRLRPGEHFQDYDLVLTTYGILRRDILALKDIPFDYCILDEAQAVKNANTEAAKAVRVLQAEHRLVMSGTPIENHLGELWSLFEFLNPGMLGAASVFKLGNTRNADPETRALLARALRPFILRRTKEQVAKDLPAKTEQTVYCELEPEQRKLYDELRDHYRLALMARVARDGMAKSKMHVLEALLRLRQAACHPGLLDKKRLTSSSAKLDTLMPQLAEVLEGNHKVLVFSQFTSFLAIVRDRLEKEKITYEYLDGQTRNRQARVERFQNDPNCKLFLISLKAGGLGLNLTAAEYVYLLDPWWNPAVEAQAIDRTHRIGQTNPVFAYRLIAKGTVEEKVLELQKTKRDLADSIINADNSLIGKLGKEDLELLLS